MTDPWMDRLSEYLDGDLAPAERAALEAHLVDCASCRATTEDLRRLVARPRTLVDRPVRCELCSVIDARIGTAGLPARLKVSARVTADGKTTTLTKSIARC